MLLRTVKRRSGLLSSLKKAVNIPKKYARNILAPTGDDAGIMPNSNLNFEEVAQEWIANMAETTYEIANTQNIDAHAQGNFGTVDNPHLIFVNDIPFRFVGCTGQPNEDDYEGHEIMYFLLREGPMQRCMGCGQVFKLIRLRHEDNIQNQYYTTGMLSTNIQELGEADHWAQQSPLRLMQAQYENTQFESNTNNFYSLINPDEHDKVLVDPSYRLEKIQKAEEALENYKKTINDINEAFLDMHGDQKAVMNKQTYENLVDAELAISELDVYARKIQKWNLRSIMDRENHERREKRMAEMSKKRVHDSHTLYFDNFTEEELQYRDYFETDLELEMNNESKMRMQRKVEALDHREMVPENISFQERYTSENHSDASSILQRKVFRFKFRANSVSAEQHNRREKRMYDRMPDFQKILGNFQKIKDSTTQIENVETELDYYNDLINLSCQNYKNYFESDLEEDFQYIVEMPTESKLLFAEALSNEVYEEFLFANRPISMSFERERNPETGFIENSYKMMQLIQDKVLPRFNRIQEEGVSAETLKKLNEDEKKKLN